MKKETELLIGGILALLAISTAKRTHAAADAIKTAADEFSKLAQEGKALISPKKEEAKKEEAPKAEEATEKAPSFDEKTPIEGEEADDPDRALASLPEELRLPREQLAEWEKEGK